MLTSLLKEVPPCVSTGSVRALGCISLSMRASKSTFLERARHPPYPNSQSCLIPFPFGDAVLAVPQKPQRTSVGAVSPQSFEPSGDLAIKSLLLHNLAQLGCGKSPFSPNAVIRATHPLPQFTKAKTTRVGLHGGKPANVGRLLPLNEQCI